MKSIGAKIGFVIFVIVVFGGAMYFLYGPNSDDAKQKEWARNEYSKYIRTEAQIISWESNGRVGKGADNIYTIQYKVDKTQSLITTTVRGREPGFDLYDKEIGDKVFVYYNPDRPNVVTSELSYNEAIK